MKALLRQLQVTVRLHFRNRMALLYSYLFPTVFLVVFWVLYRHDTVPLVRHMGELLTVTALGGACFGLPTSMVADRERGVWRRFRLTPTPTGTLVASTALARYLLLLIAALLQIALAMSVFGMPAPRHPLDLLVAFTFVAFAFIGLGLVIAMVADNVPAVQALGQCIFLPMLVIGGVAVPIENLPGWAQQLSAYFPGRYAVAAIQVSVDGEGIGSAPFSLLALALIGAAGCLAGAKLFRWDQHQRFLRLEGKGWAAGALAAWVFVGVLAQATGQVSIGVPQPAGGTTLRSALGNGPLAENEVPILPGTISPTAAETAAASGAGPALADTAAPSTNGAVAVEGAGGGSPASSATASSNTGASPGAAQPSPRDPAAGGEPGGAPAVAAGSAPASPEGTEPWRIATLENMRNVRYADLPPDHGVIAPVASLDEEILPDAAGRIDCIQQQLAGWPPARVADPVQRVRNILYVAAAADVLQMAEIERALPLVVFEHLEQTIPREDLTRILYYIGARPTEGGVAAARQLESVCLEVEAPPEYSLRERTQVYALKLLGRMIGAIPRG